MREGDYECAEGTVKRAVRAHEDSAATTWKSSWAHPEVAAKRTVSGVMPGSSRRLAQALANVCRVRPPGPGCAAKEVFSSHVRRHGLAPLTHVGLSRAQRPEAASFLPDFLDAVGAHTRNLAALRLLSDALDGLVWVVLKGPVLSELAHPVPGVRDYSDLDILVRPADLAEAVDRLDEAGWRQLDRHHCLVLERMPGELHFLGPFGAQLDLHWSLVNSRAARSSMALSSGELLSRRTWRNVAQLVVPTLDDADLLLHLCVHTALSGADRMLWLLDVDQWVRSSGLEWAEFLARAHSSRVLPACFVTLGRARRALGTPVPDAVLRSLSGASPWHAAEIAVRALRPVERVRAERGATRLVARASRDRGASSSWELARRAASSVGPRRPVDSVWQDAPDLRAWESFLSRVAQER